MRSHPSKPHTASLRFMTSLTSPLCSPQALIQLPSSSGTRVFRPRKNIGAGARLTTAIPALHLRCPLLMQTEGTRNTFATKAGNARTVRSRTIATMTASDVMPALSRRDGKRTDSTTARGKTHFASKARHAALKRTSIST